MTDEDPASQALWSNNFEARRLTAMTALFQAAVSEYQREVDSSLSRMHFYVWISALRWILIGAQLMTTHLGSMQRFGFVVQALLGLSTELGGILIILRGRAYYRAARDHMVLCAEQLQPGDWSPASTRRAKSRIWKVRNLVIAILLDFALGDLSLLVWVVSQ